MDAQTGGHCHWYLMLSDFTTFKLFHLFLTYFQRYETWEDPCLDWRELPNCHWHRRPRQEDLEFYILIQHSTLLSPLRSCPKSKVQYHSCWNRIIFETQAKLLSHCLKNIEFYEIPSRVAIWLVTLAQRVYNLVIFFVWKLFTYSYWRHYQPMSSHLSSIEEENNLGHISVQY